MDKINTQRISYLHIFLLVAVLAVLIWSGIGPKDFATWVLEVLPVIIGLVLIIPTYNRYRLTNLLYTLIAIHCIILCVGGHYSYAEVPAGKWVQDWFGFSRNHYDRLGHLFQGFMPAILAREIFIRNRIVTRAPWVFILSFSVCLAFSAFYEFIEWWVAIFSGDGSPAFLGTQGDVWDTQWDMFCAAIGAISSQLLLFKIHDGQLARFMSPVENKNSILVPEIETTHRFYATLSANDIPGLVKLFDPEILRVEFPGLPAAGTYRGKAEVQAHVEKGRSTWAEGACVPEKILVVDDKVIAFVHVHVRLKDKTDWIDGHVTDVLTFKNGKIIGFHSFIEKKQAYDFAGLKTT
jgi:putative membrane protein